MPLDFPNSPNVNDTFTSGTRTWKWNGTSWDLVPIGHTHAMADLVNFAVSSPATGQALVYNGTKWANSAALPQASVTNLTTDLAGKAALTHTHYASDINTYVSNVSGDYWVGQDNPTANRLVKMNNAGPQTFFIQTYLANAGDRMDVIQMSTGSVTFAASGITLRMPTGKTKLTGQYSAATVICVTAGSEYVVVGDLA
jgi:hypothetical protein